MTDDAGQDDRGPGLGGKVALLALAQSALFVVMSLGSLALGAGQIDKAFEAAADVELWMFMAGALVVFHALQAMVLWPVRRPAARRARGTSLGLSIVTCAFLVSFLVGAFAVALTDALRDRQAESPWWVPVTACALAAGWIVGWVLFRRFLDQRPHASREELLGSIARSILVGTVFEAIAIVPLDVMLRRKTDCYCFAGTLFAWTVCMAVGIVVLGPAVLLPLLVRRRAGWYAAHCDACGNRLEVVRDDYRTTRERCARCGDTSPRHTSAAITDAADGQPGSPRA